MKIDRYIGSITLTSSNNTFIFRENGTPYTRAIGAGTYWLYDCANQVDEIQGKPSFYRALRVSMDATQAGGNAYGIRLANLLGEGVELYRGLLFERVAGSFSFGFDFSNVNFTLPKYLLGFPQNFSINVLASGSQLRSSTGVRGHWIAPHQVISKISYPSRKVESSTEEIWRDDSYQLTWQSYTVRLVRYQWIPAQFIHSSRNQDHTYTETYQTLLGDTSLALQNLWESDLSQMKDVLILHDIEPHQNAMRVDLHKSQVECVRLFDPNFRASFEACVELSLSHGEQYNINLPLVRRPLNGNGYNGGYTW